jgi:hypothetical protein
LRSVGGEHLGVVDQAVDHRGGDDLVAEHLSPPAERLIAGDDQAGPLIPGGDELEEQVGGFCFERDVADLVNLCGHPHSLTYADTATMPRILVLGFGWRDDAGVPRRLTGAGAGIVAG